MCRSAAFSHRRHGCKQYSIPGDEAARRLNGPSENKKECMLYDGVAEEIKPLLEAAAIKLKEKKRSGKQP